MMLQEENICLRRLDEKDADRLAMLADNKKIWDNLRDALPYPYTIEDAYHFIRLTQQEQPQVTFAIHFNNEFCGMIGLVLQTDVYRKTAEIGYWLGEAYWNKGIVTRAVRLITGYGLGQLGLNRIHAGIFEYNTGSMKVLLNNGYTLDCIFKKSILKNEKVYDEHRFSITV